MAAKRRKANYKAYCFIACSQSDLGWNANCLSFQSRTLNRGCVRLRKAGHSRFTERRGHTHTEDFRRLSVVLFFFFFATLFSLVFLLFPLFFKMRVLQPSSRPNQTPIQTDSSLSPSHTSFNERKMWEISVPASSICWVWQPQDRWLDWGQSKSLIKSSSLTDSESVAADPQSRQ